MTKFFLGLIAAYCLFGSCNPKDNSIDSEKSSRLKDKDKSQDDEAANNDEETDNTQKVAKGMCNCMNGVLDGLSSKSKRMIIKAGNSSNPTQTLQSEIMKIEDPEEKQSISQEFKKVGSFSEDPEVKDCINKLEKKYNVNDKGQKVQKKIIKHLEENGDCEMVSALMKIGLKQNNMNTEE